jgi:hypothetical protein
MIIFTKCYDDQNKKGERHIACIGTMTNARKNLNRKLVGKRPPEIPWHKWKEMKMDL